MRDVLLEKLTALDFAATDLHLYLDTHPCDTEAIENYNHVVTEAKKAREEYEKRFGPIYAFRSENAEPSVWLWADDPWPWEQPFNFHLNEGAL